MLASSFCASRLSDATCRMSATELVCAGPSQQRRRRSWQHLEEGRGGTSRPRAARRISSVAAASAPLQQQQQATAVSRDDEWSTGALLLKLFQERSRKLSHHFPIKQFLFYK